MKTRATGWFTVCLLSVYVSAPPAMAAPTSQATLIADAKTPTEGGTRPQTGQLKATKSAVVAKNYATRPEVVRTDVTATAAPAKAKDKETIGRCWKRLMTMAREINHAHRHKSK